MAPIFPSISVVLLLVWTSAAFCENDPLFLVPTSWVADRLNDPTLVLLHVGTRDQYDSNHIPGAHFIALSDISTRREEGSVVLELPSVAHLDSVFESVGISDDSRIVVYYGGDWISPSARVYLTLDYLGLGNQTSIMDGGMQAWVGEGNPTTSAQPAQRKGSFNPQPRPDVIVTLEWVKENLENPAIALIDSRNTEFYTGEDLGNSVRRGHLPGARSVPFTEMVDDSLRFKGKAELREILVAGGLSDERTAVSYCHIGQQASLTYFVARYLGYEARMYDGSMNEWSRYPDLPMVAEEQQ